MPPLPTATKTGWCPIRVTDLRAGKTDLSYRFGECARCNRRDLRFVHTVEGPDGERVQVGSECARRLCSGYDPTRAEAQLRRRWEKRSRWLTRKWRRSGPVNETLTFRHGEETVRVTV